ncbi:hypothetical protein LINGRAHAP2_LOCUS30967, partial [Linum grandiflorum]
AYCLDNSLPFNEIVYRVKSGETIVSLSRKDLLTLLDGKHMSVEALDVYCDYLNWKHVEQSGNVVKRWICPDHLAYRNLVHYGKDSLSPESK